MFLSVPTLPTEDYNVNLDASQNIPDEESIRRRDNRRDITTHDSNTSSGNNTNTNSNNRAESTHNYKESTHNQFIRSEFHGTANFGWPSILFFDVATLLLTSRSGDTIYSSQRGPPIDPQTRAQLEKLGS